MVDGDEDERSKRLGPNEEENARSAQGPFLRGSFSTSLVLIGEHITQIRRIMMEGRNRL